MNYTSTVICCSPSCHSRSISSRSNHHRSSNNSNVRILTFTISITFTITITITLLHTITITAAITSTTTVTDSYNVHGPFPAFYFQSDLSECNIFRDNFKKRFYRSRLAKISARPDFETLR